MAQSKLETVRARFETEEERRAWDEFLADYEAACGELGTKFIPNSGTFSYMIRNGRRKTTTK